MNAGIRRLVFLAGVGVLCAWVIVPIYLIALGAFGGRTGVFRWPKSLWSSEATLASFRPFSRSTASARPP